MVKNGFAVRQHVAFPSAPGSVEQIPLKLLVPVSDPGCPLSVFVLVRSSAHKNFTVVCNTERYKTQQKTI